MDAPNSAARLRCTDCGTSAAEAGVALHRGTASAPDDEGHVRFREVPLCTRCVDRRVANQETMPIFG